jgi:hypothetical protein
MTTVVSAWTRVQLICCLTLESVWTHHVHLGGVRARMIATMPEPGDYRCDK